MQKKSPVIRNKEQYKKWRLEEKLVDNVRHNFQDHELPKNFPIVVVAEWVQAYDGRWTLHETHVHIKDFAPQQSAKKVLVKQ